jgi:carbonic anhydrase/acetyltransferase-like protein (isoleucine patch superfamily)
MENVLKNERKFTFRQKVLSFYLKIKYKEKLFTNGPIRIFGELPVFKLPGNGRINLGEKVVLNSDRQNTNTALTFNCTLVCGLNGEINIGDNTMLNGVSVTSYQKVNIGSNCQIASCTLISDTDFHPINPDERNKESMGIRIDHNIVNKKEINIGNNVWIGWGCTILKGVTIGDNSIIAAGSVVLNDIPKNVIAAGNPAVVKKQI